ncbi:hypothetical protein V6N13_139523 [Hibiscus sabdariffa]|uniref:Uncharacterized protein n=1 Tax=Hibiscus sabdariffa TaxID=183260 RepID=A0ABR2C7V5_9ROSI
MFTEYRCRGEWSSPPSFLSQGGKVVFTAPAEEIMGKHNSDTCTLQSKADKRDVRAGISLYGNGWAMQKSNSPLPALLSHSSSIAASRKFLEHTTTLEGMEILSKLGLWNSKVKCKAAANVPGDSPTPTGMNLYERIVETLTTLFPVWVILGTIVGIYKPDAVTWLGPDLFTLGLGFLMLSMGLTLTFEDFRRCLRNPWTVGVGFLAQYLIKPILGFTIAKALKLSAPLATGLILVSSCPGGQASNVATYISKGNVALSVLMTTCSTIGAIVMTPLLTTLLAGQLVPVNAAGLAMSTFQVVLVPTVIGVLFNEFFPKFTSKIISVTPLIGVILTTLLCASPIGLVSEVLKAQGAQLIFPVALLHVAAFALGYWVSKLSFGESTSRTISIECGMQSSALGFLLAKRHFTNPLVMVPSAVSVVFMALGGSGLAVFWRNKPIPLDDKDDFKE